jgi:hypothetical protein
MVAFLNKRRVQQLISKKTVYTEKVGEVICLGEEQEFDFQELSIIKKNCL